MFGGLRALEEFSIVWPKILDVVMVWGASSRLQDDLGIYYTIHEVNSSQQICTHA